VPEPSLVGSGALERHLRSRRDAGHKLLVPYVTGGLDLGGHRWTEVVRAFADAGADAIEVGIPFSDPVMDGPTIQEASERALEGGANLPEILAALRDIDSGAPLVVMTYVNLLFHQGYQRFAAEAVESGVAGVILPDLPLEELGEWEPTAQEHGLSTVQLASPLSDDERLVTLCARSEGFVYGVNLLGVTGERAELASSSTVLAKRLKAATDLPVVMGFGISTPAHAVEAAAVSDGVVVASALMRQMLDGASPEELGDTVARFRAALDAG
jgi:tryptophan synthase alpha chain